MRDGHENVELRFDGPTYPQLAFGMGIQACWGRQLAMVELRIMTAMMALKFDCVDVLKALASHAASYGIPYEAKVGYLNLRSP